MENTAEIDKQVMTHLDERTRRIYAAGLAKKYRYGGVSKVHRELGLDDKTIRRGLKELEEEPLQLMFRLIWRQAACRLTSRIFHKIRLMRLPILLHKNLV